MCICDLENHSSFSFFNVARYAIPVACYTIRVARDAICVSWEGGNLHLGGTVTCYDDNSIKATIFVFVRLLWQKG